MKSENIILIKNKNRELWKQKMSLAKVKFDNQVWKPYIIIQRKDTIKILILRLEHGFSTSHTSRENKRQKRSKTEKIQLKAKI